MIRYLEFLGNTEWKPDVVITGRDRSLLKIVSIPIAEDASLADIDALIVRYEKDVIDHKPYQISIHNHYHDEGRPQDCYTEVIGRVR